MHSKKIWANMGVADLDRTTKFYTEIGIKPNGTHSSKELRSFFFGDDEFVIHFFLKDILKSSMKGELADLTNGSEVLYTLSASSKEEVDNWETAVNKAGGTIISLPEEFGNGYYGFNFADPDGHRFNVFYMKGL